MEKLLFYYKIIYDAVQILFIMVQKKLSQPKNQHKGPRKRPGPSCPLHYFSVEQVMPASHKTMFWGKKEAREKTGEQLLRYSACFFFLQFSSKNGKILLSFLHFLDSHRTSNHHFSSILKLSTSAATKYCWSVQWDISILHL